MKNKLAFWAAVSRAPFFTASALPVGLGAAAAWYHAGQFDLPLFAATLVGAVLLHAGANIANDYYDHLSGADDINPDYFTPLWGGSRMIQQGLMTPRATLVSALACLGAGALIGLVLTWLRGWPVLALGAAGAAMGFFYTAPPLKLSYRGLGEVAVALSFGALMVAGAEYVQTRAVSAVGLAASVPVSLLILLVLYVNEFPDATADGRAGKRHLVVRLGRDVARLGVPLLYTATYASIICAIASGLAPAWCLLALLSAPLAVGASAVVVQYRDQPRRLVPASAMTIAAHAATTALLIIGYVLGARGGAVKLSRRGFMIGGLATGLATRGGRAMSPALRRGARSPHQAARGGDTAARPRRFLLDNDGTNFFVLEMTDDVERDIARTVAECPSNVTTYLLCPNGIGKFYYPTRIGEVWPAAQRLIAAHARGLDPFGMFLAALRAAGKETFITYRMNEVHNADDPDCSGTAEFKRRHPEYIVDAPAVAQGRADWMCWCLDYGRPQVREYILATIRELLERYPVDGLQLDWMRFPRHLSGTPQQVWAQRDVLTEFTAAVRQLVQQGGRRILLSARVPTNPGGCRHLGLDVAEWARRGLVDFIVASSFLVTDFVMLIAELRQLMGDNPVPIYADIEFGHATQHHCPESLRAAALSLFDCGADGIYMFNFPCWNEYLAARPYHWLAHLHQPQAAARKPLLFSVSHRSHRVPDVDLPGQLPVSLAPGESRDLTLHLPQAALPARRALLLVHSGGDVSLSINGDAAPERPQLRRAELFVEYVDEQSPHRPRREDCRVFDAAPSLLRAGGNSLALTNKTGSDLEIKRINLGLW